MGEDGVLISRGDHLHLSDDTDCQALIQSAREKVMTSSSQFGLVTERKERRKTLEPVRKDIKKEINEGIFPFSISIS